MITEMSKNKTLLLVEDQVIIALAQKANLEKYGYHVIVAGNGEKALAVACDKEIQIDLILMDIDLGQTKDGTQIAEEILKTEDIPILFLSSHREPEIVKKTEKITSYGYVTKDSGMVVLDASIKMALKLHKAHQALNQAKNDWESIFNAVGQPAVILSPDFKIIKANNAVIKASNIIAEEIIGKNCFDLFHHDTEPPKACPLKKLLKTRQFESTEMRVEALNGYYQVSCTPVLDKNNTLSKIIHFATDISELINTEESLKLMSSALENSTDAVGMTNFQGYHFYQNKAFLRLFGDLGNNPPSMLYKDKKRCDEIFEILKSGGE